MQQLIHLFEAISVQLSSAISKPGRSLFRGDVSLRFGHQLVSEPGPLALDKAKLPVSTHPTKNFLTVALLSSGG